MKLNLVDSVLKQLLWELGGYQAQEFLSLEIQGGESGADQQQHLSQQSFHLRFSDVLPVLLVDSQ